MTATTVNSNNVANVVATPRTALDRKSGRVKTIVDSATVATTSLDETGDIVLFGPIPSNAVILGVKVVNADLDSNGTPALTVDWGLYYSGIGGNQAFTGKTIGTVIDADVFEAADTALQAAVKVPDDKRLVTDAVGDIVKEAWEAGGLSSDPGGLFLVGMTVVTAAGTAAAGDVVVRIEYIQHKCNPLQAESLTLSQHIAARDLRALPVFYLQETIMNPTKFDHTVAAYPKEWSAYVVSPKKICIQFKDVQLKTRAPFHKDGLKSTPRGTYEMPIDTQGTDLNGLAVGIPIHPYPTVLENILQGITEHHERFPNDSIKSHINSILRTHLL